MSQAQQQIEVSSRAEHPRGKGQSIAALQVFRAIIGSLLTVFLAVSIDFGTSTWLLVAAVLGGIFISVRFLQGGRSFLTAAIIHGVLAAACFGALWVAQSVQLNDPESAPFTVFRFAEHIWLIAAFYAAAFLLSWLFWTKQSAVTVEATVVSGVFVYLLGAHRNYQLDAPKNIMRFAWDNPIAQIEPQHMLLALGIAYTLVLALYLILAHERPIFGSSRPIHSRGRARFAAGAAVLGCLVVFMLAYASIINRSYSADLSRASNGVGSNTDSEGESPLGFHSAVGKTRQPSALVRMETGYEQNPWSPMLYLREGALSQFNGRELVIASNEFDQDVPRIKPGQPYISNQRELPENRTKVVQSIYFLTKHKSLFALDYPQSIRLIKNPDEDKFSLAYQAVSFAPVIKLDSLIGEEVGNPNWDEATRAHYLRAPGSMTELSGKDWEAQYKQDEPVPDKFGEDLRYRAFARKLSATFDSPIQKVTSIVKYLSDKSLYTRKPGHSTTEKGDPVAPYLFSDEMRGYCVHFAHAAVYMFRLLGIPSRIATGYLTDLTYAKDGHVLLHLGDRHAWPEVYVTGVGWVVADITPANAENEEPIVPDEKLLEELMDKLDPAQELVEPPPLAPEDIEEEALLDKVATKRNVASLLILLVILYIASKLWLRNSWRFASSEPERVRRAYIAFASLASDVGIPRRLGETRWEYADRLKSLHSLDASALTALSERSVYGHSINLAGDEIKQALEKCNSSFDSGRSKLKRFFAFFSPMSLRRWGKW